MNNSKECPSFEGCNASLCPLEESSLETGIWYPDEEICKNQKVNHTDWIKRQRKLVRRAMPNFHFTYQMLSHKFRVCKRIKGLDTDKPLEPQLVRWFSHHPELKEHEPSPKQIEAQKKFALMAKKSDPSPSNFKKECC